MGFMQHQLCTFGRYTYYFDIHAERLVVQVIIRQTNHEAIRQSQISYQSQPAHAQTEVHMHIMLLCPRIHQQAELNQETQRFYTNFICILHPEMENKFL